MDKPKVTQQHAPPGQCVVDLVRELARAHFYGSLEVKFEAGRIVLVRKTQTIKPNETNNYPNNGVDNNEYVHTN